MASRQTYRSLSAVTPLARGQGLGLRTMHSDARPTAAVLATRAFEGPCQHGSRTQRTTPPPPLPKTACSLLQRQGLSTSAGAAHAGTGEDDIADSSKGSSSSKDSSNGSSKGSPSSSSDGSGRATRDGGAAVRSERTRGGTGAARAGAGAGAGAGKRPVDARGMPRAKQRVDVELGTFHEFSAVNKNGGKIFEASRTLIPAKDALVFPTMEVSNLSSECSPYAAMEEVNFVSRVLAGRVTMVGLFHRQFGYSMLPSWTEPFEEAFGQPRQSERGENPRKKSTAATAPSAVSISLLESWPLRMLKPLLVSTMGRGMSPEARAAFFYRFGPTEEVRKALGIANRLTLYVLLVDQKGRVRWQGTGKSTPDEVESLIRCARDLTGESSSGSDGSGDGEAVAPRGGSRAGSTRPRENKKRGKK